MSASLSALAFDGTTSPVSLPAEILAGDALLHADVFSIDQLKRHALSLGAWHRSDRGRGPNPLLARLEANEGILRGIFRELRNAERAVVPAGEWLLDNHHLVLEQIATARRHLPRRYSHELPRLSVGDPKGAPRVYGLALELISHTDSRVDEDSLLAFIGAYQEVAPLTLGELWAVPTMLRLALLENLRRIAVRVSRIEAQRQAAGGWAERLLRTADEEPSALVIALGDLAREELPGAGFVAELHRRLQGQNPSLVLVLQWLDQRLAERHRTIAELIRLDHQAQAADQLAVENAITSLRRMGAIDWRAFVERLSTVEQLLRRDPAGVYPTMDFATRDRYRHAIERLARRCPPGGAASETMVAETVLGLCVPSAEAPTDHVGWWLIDAGRAGLEQQLARRTRLRPSWRRRTRPLPVAVLLAPLAVATAGATAGVAALAGPGIAALAALPLSQAALQLGNWIATRLTRPHALARLALLDGVPADLPTLVVVPTMLRHPQDVEHLVEGLLVRYLANRDPGLGFALLTDFGDAASAETPADASLIAQAEQAIAALNAQYEARFVLLHRPRLWNPGEGVWMGRERKRGKLEDLNRLLLTGERQGFSHVSGALDRLVGVRFVIVLDTDTRLPRDAARDLVATIAHPLNRPRVDPASGLVIGGHGLIQPRAAIALGSARQSWYASLWSSEAGIDPYTRAVSDVYQDLFHEGSFIGKGIYDLVAFDHAVGARFPANAILSHDLIEGCFARSALATDVLVVEDHPSRYLADIARRKRWVRGDWQLLPWLGRQVPTATGRGPNVLSALSRWKLFDNLRRSLVPPATLAVLLALWAACPAAIALGLTAGLLGLWLLPWALGLLWALPQGGGGEAGWEAHFRQLARDGLRGLTTIGFDLLVLPFEAATWLDAIARTSWRLARSRRHLLEWQTSTDAERQVSGRLVEVVRTMALNPVVGAGTLVLAWLRPDIAPAAVPIALGWIAAPGIAWFISRPRRFRTGTLGEDDLLLIRRLARRTWGYFAEQVAGSDQPLPPDNVQELPVAAVARRTSPTNIGLALLAELAAHDLGWQTTSAMLTRIDRLLTATRALERYRGHLFNWYDTVSGKPLAPRYISTVDSGNLAGHLLVLAAGLRELAHGLPEAAQRLAGVRSTLACAGTHESLALAQTDADLAQLATSAEALAPRSPGEAGEWCTRAVEEARAHLAELALAPAEREALVTQAAALATQAIDFALAAEWDFLFDHQAKLFAIGWQAEESRLDRSSYDLLASESRLGSYVAIATGAIPQEHWFRLGRRQIRCAGGHALVSWSGTLFEYLMPTLVMPEEPGTLLATSNLAAVAEQRRYGDDHQVPWGISESAYHLTDAQLNWQYRAFGVPGLGLKRGLGDDLVIAPYATALALLVDPPAAVANLRRLGKLGAEGRYGFCEAIDFTTARLPAGTNFAVIRSWMVHHQGMTLLACTHVLAGAPMQRRFLADPRLQAHRLLLQERPVPVLNPLLPAPPEAGETRATAEITLRVLKDPYPTVPEVHLLANGRWSLLITAAGAGVSRWRDLTVTRWREDSTRDGGGPAIYLRDAADGRLWSAAAYPVGRKPEAYEAIFTQSRAEFRRLDAGISAHTEIAISPEDDVELRRVTLANLSTTERVLEFTTYAEPVLAPLHADLAHPSFANLFVETDFIASAEALLATRRPRRPDEPRRFLVHLMVVRDAAAAGTLSWETDRRAFIGRGRSPAAPAALGGPVGGALGGHLGAVLDPALALRRTIRLPAGARIVVDVIYALAEQREAAIGLAHRYRDAHLADRIFGLSWTNGQVVLAQLGASEQEAQVFGRLAGALTLPTPHRRAPQEILRNRRTRSGLWSHGISGDLPIMLLRVTDGQRLDLVRQSLRAHAWWRGCGLHADLVILIEDPSLYRQELTERVIGLVGAGPAAGLLDRPGGIFVRRADQVPEEDRHLLAAAARLVVTDAGGSLAQFAERRIRPEPAAPRFVAQRPQRTDAPLPAPPFDLREWNGLGGFTADGREYILVLPPGTTTPLPWCNVLANADFGTVVSERGAAYTWAGNSHEFRLSPWRCDAVSDPHGEALYLRDEETGACWSPTPGPLPARSTRVVRHGFGYSAFMAGDEGIATELHMWVDAAEPVKHLRLRLINRSGRVRRLAAFAWCEWTLGELRERTAAGLVTEHEDGALFVRNPLHDEQANHHAFLVASRRPVSWTCDNSEFLGRGGGSGRPAALAAGSLLERAGAALDPCAALHLLIELEPGQEQEVVFTIGCGRDRGHAASLVAAHRSTEAAARSLDRVYDHWKELLGRVQVRTSDPTLDLLANGWLAYQVVASRILARSGFSQSGGAWGFRDQLQDAMGIALHEPRFLREQLIRCAGRQFREGDVQHWWHPPQGRGVRTRISDDLLWLPFALCRYLDVTGDTSVLTERIPFLESPQIPADQESLYDLPTVGGEVGTVYEHAARAVLHALRFGAHGLPLMGGGDWNDGMDRVGHHGRGESVWLGFFLVEVLRRFAPLAKGAGDDHLADRLQVEADALAKRIDVHAWEEDRYLRAWMDDGTPLGSAAGSECRLDALPQAWAALTGACRLERACLAMETVDRQLVRRSEGLIQLFDPPFADGPVEPGYIKGYVPGVRENGGQYTHAAVWTAMAFAALGDGARALELTRLIDPIRHGADPARWQGEPYVLAADVYRTAAHTGRAGWTWYTGSAGWMLRLINESLLGLVREGDTLRITPCLPASFGTYQVIYRRGTTRWRIQVRLDGDLDTLHLDGGERQDRRIPLTEDGHEHQVVVVVRRRG